MLITRVELQNVKSYRDETIAFAEGTNAICGENGAGKSTLLEAIGFALFDFLPYTQSDFVREGEKTAAVAVSFISSQDGREYQAVRRGGVARTITSMTRSWMAGLSPASRMCWIGSESTWASSLTQT